MNDKIEIVEDEDVARAKAWWQENGSSIIGGIVIGTTLVVGYNFWNKYTEQQAEEASTLYQQAINTDQGTLAEEAVQQLQTDFSTSIYSSMALMKQAKTQVDNEDLNAAASSLNAALEMKGTDAPLASIIRLRLASVHIASANHDKALAVLNDNGLISADSLTARVEELKGDALFGKADTDGARAAYEASLAAASGSQSRTLVQLKLDNL